ncbi:hypothetical protein Mal4_13710 [Maioricimonas rarisocia]|uniref:Fructose-bisphosphate aldolase n=1 Tax=Maioricimonas rarisocia TaxID=2528026 RepID=A0A517Z3M8_9PLAN|nr:hypothetical protein [Maioricimonas rarisocia]QDU37068.1 hypothetical protein Mal4_13710 [Maioricimonas rarisocia]
MQKSLDRKLAAIHADPQGCPEFIIADAKDADMAFGIGAPGLSPERHDTELKYKTLAEYREQIRAVIRQGIVDIVLMSASTSEHLTLREGLFDNSHVTPAIRANDATDVHAFRGSRIPQAPAHPFRTALIDHAQCGHLDCAPEERPRGANLGLYSVTFNNDLELDLHTLEQYNAFRAEAERKGFRHFLELFNPNVPGAVSDEQLPYFINDVIARTLAGVASAGRPVFLKIPYNGPHAMEELVAYDPHLIVGVLGGSAGTTLDAFTLLYEAKKYGARAALFGRKINQAENQLAFIEFLRHIADGVIEPIEAVRAYHAVLEKLGQKPTRSLEDDLTLQTNVMSYGGSSTFTSLPPTRKAKGTTGVASTDGSAGDGNGASPDFGAMSSEERLEYHRQRLGLASTAPGDVNHQ